MSKNLPAVNAREGWPEPTDEMKRLLDSRWGERLAIRMMLAILSAFAAHSLSPMMTKMAREGVVVGEYVMRRWRVLKR